MLLTGTNSLGRYVKITKINLELPWTIMRIINDQIRNPSRNKSIYNSNF